LGIWDLALRIGDLQTICLKCLEKEPSRRYPTAQDLADDLQRFLDDEPILARPISSTARFWRWCRRRPAIAALSVALLFALLGGFAGTLWQLTEARQNAAEKRRHIARLPELAGRSVVVAGILRIRVSADLLGDTMEAGRTALVLPSVSASPWSQVSLELLRVEVTLHRPRYAVPFITPAAHRPLQPEGFGPIDFLPKDRSEIIFPSADSARNGAVEHCRSPLTVLP
jgi:hypothetical protein